MTDSGLVNYHTISPSSEDQGYHSDAHDARVDNLYSTTCWRISTESRTKWTYFLLGCAILVPWNALANGTSFFLSRMAGSPFYSTFSSYLSSVFMLTKLGCQSYCTITSKQSSPSRRIFASMIGIIIIITSLCTSTFVRGTPSTVFMFALFNAALSAIATGYLCTAVYAGAALLGSSYLQIVFSGQAAIAVAISVVQVASSIIALWDSPPKSVSIQGVREGRDDLPEEVAARIFFGVSAVFLCITLVAYTWLTRQPFYKLVTRSPKHLRRVEDMDELARLLADDDTNPSSEPKSDVYRVLRQNWIFMFPLAYVFAITLAIFPAITARVQPVSPGIHPMLFTAIHFLIFNAGDLLGRYSCSFPWLVVWSGKKILVMSLLRTMFIPLVLLCNIDPHMTVPIRLPIIHSDVLFMVIIFALGYTGGHVSTLALITVSSLEHNPGLKGRREDVDVAATLGSTFMMLGLAVGSLCSFGVQAII